MGKIKSALDIWLAFLIKNNLLNKDNLPPVLEDPNLKKALSALEVMNFASEEREAYEDHLKWLMIEANSLKKSYEQGWEEGRAEGEYNKAVAIARKMLSQNYSLPGIATITGLSSEEIANCIKVGI